MRDLLARAGYPSEPGEDGLGAALRAFVGAENLEARWWHEERLDPVVLAHLRTRARAERASASGRERTGAPGAGLPSVAAIVGGGVVTGTGVRSRISSHTARAEASGRTRMRCAMQGSKRLRTCLTATSAALSSSAAA